MKIAFEKKRFRPETLEVIDLLNELLEEYDRDGYQVTARQLYYQLVAGDLFPENRKWAWTGSKWVKDPGGTINAQPNYDWIAKIINDGRMAGLIDWDLIVDLGRRTVREPSWDNPRDAVQAAHQWFRIDPWEFQPIHVEVMCEKQALEGVLGPASKKWGLPFSSNKGYSSASFMFEKGKELREKFHDEHKQVFLLYFGDHDPSGLDMDRDIEHRLEMFMGPGLDNDDMDDFDSEIILSRCALTKDQIHEFRPPPNPAKVTDSRAAAYIQQHGRVSWELDALKPSQLVSVLDNYVEAALDRFGIRENWDAALDMQRRMKAELEGIYTKIDSGPWRREIREMHSKVDNKIFGID